MRFRSKKVQVLSDFETKFLQRVGFEMTFFVNASDFEFKI